MPTIRLVEVVPPHGAEEARVAVGEDAAVGGHEPVAVGARSAGHAHDGLVQRRAARTAVVAGVTEVEDAAVGRHEAVALTAVEVAPEAVVVGGGLHRDTLGALATVTSTHWADGAWRDDGDRRGRLRHSVTRPYLRRTSPM